jgi:hypothetical protein
MEYFSIKNVGQPQNPVWKKLSKFLTRTLPIYAGAIVALPIPENTKLWFIFAQTIIVATISALSELTTNNNK